ncbi:hypothetical protein [Pseudolactococcus raffinolactis]|uniref:hypothetical protein n=1 Tax=Pseudolactococcus raffinolactis TaxID=1366 RepID=UPI00143686D1|nr:hypothetical protein [Lactococcus raffinolactis]QIW50768.1 hypothetical protein GU337_02170 [Lactococcus raffinolactis]
MKLYHTQTREDYNALMDELESKGVKWADGKKPHELDGFEAYGSGTIFQVSNKEMVYFSMDFYKEIYNELEVIEYKAEKSEKDTKISNESVLEIIENLVHATSLKSFYSLQKAKYNLDKLIEKLEVEDDTKI